MDVFMAGNIKVYVSLSKTELKSHFYPSKWQLKNLFVLLDVITHNNLHVKK